MASIESEITGQRRTDIGWLAGLIDGEGCFIFGTTPVITVDSTCRTVIEECHRIMKGSCSALKRKTTMNRPVFRWRIGGKDAIKCSLTLAPFLKDKKEQAILLASIYNYPPKSAMRDSIIRRLMTEDLDFVSTSDLAKELQKRHDELIIVGSMKRTGETEDLTVGFSGSYHCCLGLLEVGKIAMQTGES